MRIVILGAGGGMPAAAVETLAARHQVAGVVRPAEAAWRGWLRPAAVRAGLRPPDALGAITRRLGVREYRISSARDPELGALLLDLRPELVCISTFPWIVPIEALPVPAINLHPSLLPRHRGANPLFWVYHQDDRSTGVTVHRVTARADAGEILDQECFDLPRGFPVDKLHAECARRGAALLARTVDALEAGRASPTPQDETLATRAPRVQPGTAMADFENWGAERVWHFLAGLCPRFREPLHDSRGRRIVYRRVLGFETDAARLAAGVAEPAPGGWNLGCRDGFVKLA